MPNKRIQVDRGGDAAANEQYSLLLSNDKKSSTIVKSTDNKLICIFNYFMLAKISFPKAKQSARLRLS
jgi:hypothetical protein